MEAMVAGGSRDGVGHCLVTPSSRYSYFVTPAPLLHLHHKKLTNETLSDSVSSRLLLGRILTKSSADPWVGVVTVNTSKIECNR